MIKCPFCGKDTKVIDSRRGDNGKSVIRKRECPYCSGRFKTEEKERQISHRLRYQVAPDKTIEAEYDYSEVTEVSKFFMERLIVPALTEFYQNHKDDRRRNIEA